MPERFSGFRIKQNKTAHPFGQRRGSITSALLALLNAARSLAFAANAIGSPLLSMPLLCRQLDRIHRSARDFWEKEEIRPCSSDASDVTRNLPRRRAQEGQAVPCS